MILSVALCLLYVLYPAVTSVKSVQMLEALMLAICVRFCSCLCKACSCSVSKALLPALRTSSLSFLTNSSSDSKAFQLFIAKVSVRRKPHAPSYVITHYRYVRVTERYTETLHVKKMADLP